MKKLLSILAAVGLTATASTAVVACTTKEVKAKSMNVTVDAAKGIYTVSTKSAITISLPDKAKKEIAKDTVITEVSDLVTDFGDNFGIFDKDGNDMLTKDNDTAFSDMTLKVTVNKKIKENAKSASIKVEVTLTAKDAAKLGLVKGEKSGKAVSGWAGDMTAVDKVVKGEDASFTLGTKTSEDKMDKKIVKADFDASKFAFDVKTK